MASNLQSLEVWVAENRLDIVHKYVIQEWTLEQLMRRTEEEHGPRATETKWKNALNKAGIFKKNRYLEALEIIRRLQNAETREISRRVLPIVDGVLQDVKEVQNYFKRKNMDPQSADTSNQRRIDFIVLPFEYQTLGDLPTFRLAREILWLASVHFNSQFDRDVWIRDERNLINRSDAMISDLTVLSHIHNTIHDAIRCSNNKEYNEMGNLLREAMWHLNTIVQTAHHRQITDALAMMYLLQKVKQPDESKPEFQTMFCDQLNGLAGNYLVQNDPRRKLFQTLKNIPPIKAWDPEGHFLVALDTFCRRLWIDRTGLDDIKAYYSYNQATFPRAQPGDFFIAFKGKQIATILQELRGVDRELGRFDHVSISLWHTALHYFFDEEKYDEAEIIATELVLRFLPPEGFDVFSGGQLNFDASKTFVLRARVFEEQSKRCINRQDAQRKACQALVDLEYSLNVRRLLVHRGVWDVLTKSILTVLVSVTGLLGLDDAKWGWEEEIEVLYKSLDQKTRERDRDTSS